MSPPPRPLTGFQKAIFRSSPASAARPQGPQLAVCSRPGTAAPIGPPALINPDEGLRLHGSRLSRLGFALGRGYEMRSVAQHPFRDCSFLPDISIHGRSVSHPIPATFFLYTIFSDKSQVESSIAAVETNIFLETTNNYFR